MSKIGHLQNCLEEIFDEFTPKFVKTMKSAMYVTEIEHLDFLQAYLAGLSIDSLSIIYQNHERSYADWFRYIEDMSGPDELALYSLSRKYGVHTAVFNKTYIWTTLMNHINVPDEDIIAKCGVNLVFLGKYGVIKNTRTPQPQSSKPPATGSKRTKGKVTCRNGTRGRKLHAVEALVEGPGPRGQEH